MLIITCRFQQYLKGADGEYSKEGRSNFSFQSSSSLEHLKFSIKRRSNHFFTLAWCFFLYFVLHCRRRLLSSSSTLSSMATKMKGIYKGFKYISQIFVVKEREMEIGYPTDVKHVAHIGWDGPAGSAPSWMNEFKTGPDFASTSIGNSGSALSPWSSQDFGESVGQQSAPSEIYRDVPSTELPNIPKKHKRKKNKSTSSPRSSRAAAKSKTKYVQGNAKSSNIEVA